LPGAVSEELSVPGASVELSTPGCSLAAEGVLDFEAVVLDFEAVAAFVPTSGVVWSPDWIVS
jgi:hypothetical protein